VRVNTSYTLRGNGCKIHTHTHTFTYYNTRVYNNGAAAVRRRATDTPYAYDTVVRLRYVSCLAFDTRVRPCNIIGRVGFRRLRRPRRRTTTTTTTTTTTRAAAASVQRTPKTLRGHCTAMTAVHVRTLPISSPNGRRVVLRARVCVFVSHAEGRREYYYDPFLFFLSPLSCSIPLCFQRSDERAARHASYTTPPNENSKNQKSFVFRFFSMNIYVCVCRDYRSTRRRQYDNTRLISHTRQTVVADVQTRYKHTHTHTHTTPGARRPLPRVLCDVVLLGPRVCAHSIV